MWTKANKIKIFTGVILFFVVACGVKGPPEPPLETEASLKKEKEEQAKKKNQNP